MKKLSIVFLLLSFSSYIYGQEPLGFDELLTKGDVYYEKADYTEAVKYFTQAINVNPKLPKGYEYRGDAYLNLEKIRARYNQITAIDVKAYYHIARSRYFSEKEMHDSSMVEAQIGLAQYISTNDVIGMTTCNFYVGMNYLKAECPN